MTSPPLPQELIDKIIDQFGDTDRLSSSRTRNKNDLASLSMVSKAWKERSQKHLFSVFDLQKLSSAYITEAQLDGLELVFSLTKDLEIDGLWEVHSQFDPMAISSLRCFRNLETLSLSGWHFQWAGPKQLSTCFGHLGETLIHLKLDGTANSDLLIYLTSMFPRLYVLEISIPGLRDEARRISTEDLPTTGSFQGYLHLWGLSKTHNDFLAFLSSTSPRFDSICADNCDAGDGLGKLLNSTAASLESLELYIEEDRPQANPTSLSECTALREIHISHPYPRSTASLLQTIRSPHLNNFVVGFRRWECAVLIEDEDVDVWKETDAELRAAHDQWVKHATGKITATFRIPGAGTPDYPLELLQRDLKRFFPRFTENVTVAII